MEQSERKILKLADIPASAKAANQSATDAKVKVAKKPRKQKVPKKAATSAPPATQGFSVYQKSVKPKLPVLKYQDLLDFGLPARLAEPLFKAVTIMRGGDSLREANFVAWLVAYCAPYAELRMIDIAGNVHFVVYTPQGAEPTTIFVAHTDTVHDSGGDNEVGFDGTYIHGVDEPLGADDGAGIAILCYMMSKKVPGRYIFSRQEESGGIGSKLIADTMGGVLKKHKRAIAFDRRGTGEVIIQQGGSECASEAFGEALSDALNEQGLLYMPSTRGVYTDTKEYRAKVAECVNISTGYYQEHGASEHLDLQHFGLLALAAVNIDWESLPTVREPKEDEYDWDFGFGRYGSYNNDYSKYGKSTATATKPDPFKTSVSSTANLEKFSDGRITPFEEAVFDWYWGRVLPLKDMLQARLAAVNGVKYEEVANHIEINKLKPEEVDKIRFDALTDEEIMDQMLKLIGVTI